MDRKYRFCFTDKILRDKTFNIASDPKYDGYQGGLASMVYNFFDKKKKSLFIVYRQHLRSRFS